MTVAWFATSKYFKENPKKLIIVAAVLAALYGGMKVKDSFDHLKTENAALTTQITQLGNEKTQLQSDVALAVQTNKNNQITIEQLSVAAIDYQKQVVDLKKAKTVLVSNNQALIQAIESSAPEDDGFVAKVLENAIKSIQADREASK
jgi:outer membrane murein-binding lipoprotein Lpp